MEFGQRLKEVRQESGLSQVDLADILGVHSMTVSRWERCIKYPDARMLKTMAILFDVTSDYLLGIGLMEEQ